MSYVNVIMYGAVLPSYRRKDGNNDNGGKDQDIIKADDPNNKDRVRKFLDGID